MKQAFSNFVLEEQTVPGAVGYTQEMVAIDVNGDGWDDLISASMYYPLKDSEIGVAVLINDRNNGFENRSNSSFSAGRPGTVHPREIVVADFNGDGLKDVFIADHGYDASPFPGHTNVLLIQEVGGGFVNRTSTLPLSPDFTHSADAADIDKDGDIDLYVGNLWGAGGQAPYFLINDGTAHFRVDRSRLPASLVGLSEVKVTSLFLDADGDGDADLFLGSDVGGSHTLLLNQKGSFLTQGPPLPNGRFAGQNTISVDAKSFDFNRDGRPDILVAETKGAPFYQGSALQVLISNGNGTFSDGSNDYLDLQPSTAGWIRYSHFVDLNDDGAVDLLCQIAAGSQEKAVAYLNDGTNHFLRLPTGSVDLTGTFAPADVNHDGRTDLVRVGDYEGKWYLRILFQSDANQKKLSGGPQADTILGDSAKQKVYGSDGNDFLFGSAGNDKIYGGKGVDRLLGGSGDDYLSGDSRGDSLTGGAGGDKFVFTGPKNGGVTVVDFTKGEDVLLLRNKKFGKLKPGVLSEKSFFVGVAADKDDHFGWRDGNLIYDKNGAKSGGETMIAAVGTDFGSDDIVVG